MDHWSLSVSLRDTEPAAIEAKFIGGHVVRYPFLDEKEKMMSRPKRAERLHTLSQPFHVQVMNWQSDNINKQAASALALSCVDATPKKPNRSNLCSR